ncbi:hypothetical protein [Synechococcus sp. ATX 2A4]|uniref:hypothetical protein n=1 Tax=Synechococcus sp. ATX 2A4 TaxID=2823727 RepID=UPI0020CD55D4|nr:hypothetical protein [Synechococcus sp. ATX 2A4]
MLSLSPPTASHGHFRTLLLIASSAALSSASLGAGPASAQREGYLLGPGSNVGPATRIVPTNCVTAPDGSVTCDTKIENPPGDTRAKPQVSPFSN